MNKRDKTLNITSADMFYESFWASESVRFEAKSLRYITRYLEKWYNVKIEVDPTIPDSQAYTFTIKDESTGSDLTDHVAHKPDRLYVRRG